MGFSWRKNVPAEQDVLRRWWMDASSREYPKLITAKMLVEKMGFKMRNDLELKGCLVLSQGAWWTAGSC